MSRAKATASRWPWVVAFELYLNHKTVRNYVSSIFTKLHVADRAEAIIRARNAGLGG